MGKRNPARRETAWLTVSQLADALDVTVDFVRREVLRRVPEDMIRRDERPMRVYARGAIERWLKPPSSESAGYEADPGAITDLDLLLATEPGE